MQKRIIINIARPEVGVEYQPATSEAEITDMAAAIELGLHALAQSNPSGGPDPGRIKHTRVYNSLSCPTSYGRYNTGVSYPPQSMVPELGVLIWVKLQPARAVVYPVYEICRHSPSGLGQDDYA